MMVDKVDNNTFCLAACLVDSQLAGLLKEVKDRLELKKVGHSQT